MSFGSKKETKGSLPSEDANLNSEIEKQNEDLESIKNWGVDTSGEEEVIEELCNSANNGSGVQIKFVEDGNIESATIDPNSAYMGSGEELLWSFDIKEGIIRRKVVVRLAITNYRIMRIDVPNYKVLGYILLPAVDDVIVMNTHRVSESTGYGMYMGRGGRYMSIAGPRFSSGTSKTVGDIVFIVNGQKIAWEGIPDPTGLKNFVKSLKRTMYDQVTKLENKSSRGGVRCPDCSQQNPKNAKFCNGCGRKFGFMCTNCGKPNPLNSSFCSECGFSLQ